MISFRARRQRNWRQSQIAPISEDRRRGLPSNPFSTSMIDVLGCGFAAVVFIFLMFATTKDAAQLALKATRAIFGKGLDQIGSAEGALPPAIIRMKRSHFDTVRFRRSGASGILNFGQAAFISDSLAVVIVQDRNLLRSGFEASGRSETIVAQPTAGRPNFSLESAPNGYSTFLFEHGPRLTTVHMYRKSVTASGAQIAASFRNGMSIAGLDATQHALAVARNYDHAMAAREELQIFTPSDGLQVTVPGVWAVGGLKLLYSGPHGHHTSSCLGVEMSPPQPVALNIQVGERGIQVDCVKQPMERR